MQAVIMASGLGKRMLPLTLERPKPLIEVSGKPILEYILDALPDEIDEIILIVGYKSEMIKKHFGDSYNGTPIRYAFQWMAGGTAHALSVARPLIHGRFLLLNADDILGKEALAEAVQHPLAILVSEHSKPEIMGVVSVREDGTLASIIEKPKEPIGNLVNTNSMVLDERLFDYEATPHETGEYYVTVPVNAFAQDHKMVVIRQPLWIPVGYPEDIPKAEAQLKELEIEEESKR